MSLNENCFNEYMTKVFKRNGLEWENVLADVQVNKEKDPVLSRLRDIAHYYYFVCLPELNEGIRDELRVVAITSIVEALMGGHKFKDVFSF